MAYQHITLKERYVIYHLLLMRLSFREIGRRLNRHHRWNLLQSAPFFLALPFGIGFFLNQS